MIFICIKFSIYIWNSKRLDYQITPFVNRDIKWCIFGHTAQNASVMKHTTEVARLLCKLQGCDVIT